MANIIFIAPLPVLRKRTRLAKMASVVIDSGHFLEFFGWQRVPGENEKFSWIDDSISESVIMKGGGYATNKARRLYPKWMIMVFCKTLCLGRKKIIFCLGWETAFPALLASLITRSKIIFDDADRFSLVLKLPFVANGFLKLLERWTSYNCLVHIIPGFARYEWSHSNMIVLRNSPTQDDLDQAKKTTHQRPEAEILLYANGWIGDTRGAPIFLDLLDLALSEKFDLKLLIAGRVDGISAPQLLAHTQTIYLGELPQHQALAWYGACDAVLTYYDPSVQINRMAESNKWGDALLLGCPIIVNSEVQTARKLVEGGAALSVNYSDVKGLLELVCRLALDPLFRNSVNESLGSFEYLYPTFDKQFQVIVDRVLSS